ncbi:HIRAN domain-containing protein [Sphingomonas sp. FUKUSWIS1]|uniref:HIRAN domain-containing protein n=1 Tax=Sphingomonas sp. FUKUSWIS1 TaxID=1379701 RepID=UPI0006945BA4|nr:HIRAN domain-containing protein [Sphingomonas sp. FUKUSWIS1]
MDELTTSIVNIDFPNEDKSKSNRRMECMLCAPGDTVELRLEPTNPFDNNAVAIFSERGTQLGYVSAERAPLIGKRMKEGEAIAVFQAMHGSGADIRIRFEGGVPTLPDPVSDDPKPAQPRPMRPAARPVYDPHAFYPDEWARMGNVTPF